MATQLPNAKIYNRGLSLTGLLNQGYNVTIQGYSVTVYSYDKNGDITLFTGTAAYSVFTAAGFAKGCIYIDTDVAAASSGTYENTGTNLVAAFAAFGGGISTTLASGNILVGNASNVATSVNPSGDVDISNDGAFTVLGTTIGTVNVTAVGNAVTSNTNAGVITSSTANLGAGTVETITLTDSKITANSRVLALIADPGTGGSVVVMSAKAASGSCAIVVNNVSETPMSSVYKVSFVVIN